MKNVYVFPVEGFDRNVSDNTLIKACCENNSVVRKYTPEEFAELINDECFIQINYWVRIIDDMEGYFPISSLHKDDLESIGYDTSKISDSDMETIARKLGDDYTEQLFWSSLPILADYVGVPSKEQDTENLE